MMQRLNILLSAFACSPYAGSEPGIGWQTASRLARFHDVTVLTSPLARGSPDWDFRADQERYLNEHGPIAGLSFRYVENPLLARLFQRETFPWRSTTYYFGYSAWQRAAYAEAVRLHRRYRFDVVHHLNIGGFREPGFLWKLPIPFVWGPISGGTFIPKPFLSTMATRDRVHYLLRNLVTGYQRRCGRRRRQAAVRARRIWVATPEDLHMVEKIWLRDASLQLDTGTSMPGTTVPRVRPSVPLRLCWSGAHIGRKSLPLLIDALASIKAHTTRIRVDVLGSGPLTQTWLDRVNRTGLNSIFTFLGNLEHDEAVRRLSEADVFIHTSLAEAASTVVLEALSNAVPVVCHDCCGMGVAVTPECGIKVPLINPETSVKGFATAIQHLLDHPEDVARLSEGAYHRAQELTWDQKVEQIADAYAAAVTENKFRMSGSSRLPQRHPLVRG